MNKESDNECLDLSEKRRLIDDDARKVVRDHCKVEHAKIYKNLTKMKGIQTSKA